MGFPVTAGAAFLSLATYYPTPTPPIEPNVVVAFTVLYAPWWLDEFDSGVVGVAPVLNTGTEVANTAVSAVQAAASTAFGHTLGTSAGGGASSGVNVLDDGDGTESITGATVVDNGDGTLTITGATVTDNGDGTESIS